MRKTFFSFLAAVVLTGLSLNSVAAKTEGVKAAPEPFEVSGLIAEIAQDGSYIVVDDGDSKTKVLTSAEVMDEAYFELGDKVSITGQKDSRGVVLLDYEYDFDYDLGVDNYEEEDLEVPAVDTLGEEDLGQQ